MLLRTIAPNKMILCVRLVAIKKQTDERDEQKNWTKKNKSVWQAICEQTNRRWRVSMTLFAIRRTPKMKQQFNYDQWKCGDGDCIESFGWAMAAISVIYNRLVWWTVERCSFAWTDGCCWKHSMNFVIQWVIWHAIVVHENVLVFYSCA